VLRPVRVAADRVRRPGSQDVKPAHESRQLAGDQVRSARPADDTHRYAVGLSLTSGFVGVRSGRVPLRRFR